MLSKFFSLIGYMILAAVGICAAPREEIVISEEFISPQWDKYDCHTSSLVQITNGDILAIWKGGYGEGKSNIDLGSKVGIWQARYDGEKWSAAEMIHFETDSVVWNPVIAQLPSHELLLFYRVGSHPQTSVAFMKRSLNEGKEWEKSELLPAGIIGPSKNKPIVLEDGTMLCPSSFQSGSPDGMYKATAVWIDISKDGGKTWIKRGPLTIPGQPFGVIEPALFFDKEGNLHLFCRDRALRVGRTDGYIWSAVSHDQGNTWSPLEKTDLPNPDSAFDIVDMGKGNLVLIYNPSQTKRFPLTIAISVDGGKTWENKCDLEEKTGEMPAAILSQDGLIHATYAYEIATGQRMIKHVSIDPAKLFSN